MKAAYRNAKEKVSMFVCVCVPFLISSKRTSILDLYIESYDSSLAILFSILSFSWNSSTAVKDKCFAFMFSCMHGVWANTVRLKTKSVVHQFKLNIEIFTLFSFPFSPILSIYYGEFGAFYGAHPNDQIAAVSGEWANELPRLDLETRQENIRLVHL